MRNEKILAALAALVMFASILFPSAISLQSASITLSGNPGKIEYDSYIMAQSGSARDIQAAVDAAEAQGGGNVRIPAGSFNFYTSGTWSPVTIPASVSIFGAPTQRDASGQVIAWQTILKMPYEAAEQSTWFRYSSGSGAPRFSDIQLTGYREGHTSSTTHYFGITIGGITDFRIDHCYFKDICGYAIQTVAQGYRGVIDHCRFVNSAGHVEDLFAQCTVWYGVNIGYGPDAWDTNIQNVLGKYQDEVYIEDCYFEKWRHCTSAYGNTKYVIRHCTIQNDYGYGSIDCHGGVYSNRVIEVYDNFVLDPIDYDHGVFHRGGGGVYFNNVFRGYGGDSHGCIELSQESTTSNQYSKDIWIWNNTVLDSGNLLAVTGSPTPQYTLSKPSWYVPYSYPHPLTIET